MVPTIPYQKASKVVAGRSCSRNTPEEFDALKLWVTANQFCNCPPSKSFALAMGYSHKDTLGAAKSVATRQG